MRTRFSCLRPLSHPLVAAILVAGGVGAACSNQAQKSETTVAPLGSTHVSQGPSDHSIAPPDAAEAPERPLEPAVPLSRGAQPTAPAQAPAQGNAPTGTPTNPSTPAPTPSSPNAPATAPQANPIPPTGGSPVGSTGSPAGNTPTSTQGATTDAAEPRMSGFDPYQARLDAGVGTAPLPRGDAGPTPSPAPTPRTDGGLGGIGNMGDGGIR